MASESCKILILSQLEYLAIRRGKNKCDGVRLPFCFRKTDNRFHEIIGRKLDFTVHPQTTDLMPLNLVTFNDDN